MVSAGRVLIMPKGDYSAEASYEMLDLVSYNGSSYIAKKSTTGNLPTNTTYWQLSAYGGSAANLAGNFATLETTDYASKDYAVDDFLVTKNSQFCKVIDSITTGDELVLDTNIEATDVGELIQAVIAYADGLDAKNVKLNGAVAITSQIDLDDMTTIGNYYKSSTSFYVTNAPTGIASELTAIFRLTVENGSDTTNKYIQTLRTNDGKTYTRAYNGSAWSDWVEFASAASVSAVNAEVTKVKTIIAPIEDGATASQAYTVGEQFIKSGVLYKAKTDIDLGDTLTLNTNYELSDDVVAQIAAVNQTLTNEVDAIVNVYGSKNLAPNEATNGSTSGGSVTITVNDDESITLNGTATANGIVVLYGLDKPFWNNALKGKNVTLTGFPQGTFPSGTVLRINFQKIVNGSQTIISSIVDSGSGASGVIPNDTTHVSYYISVANTTAFNNVTFKPMVRDARIVDPTYVPYAMTNRELTAELTVKDGTSQIVLDDTTCEDISTSISKQGRFVILSLAIKNLSSATGSNINFGTLPVGFRPLAPQSVRYTPYNNLYGTVSVKTDGSIVLYANDNMQNWSIRVNIPFICAT